MKWPFKKTELKACKDCEFYCKALSFMDRYVRPDGFVIDYINGTRVQSLRNTDAKFEREFLCGERAKYFKPKEGVK